MAHLRSSLRRGGYYPPEILFIVAVGAGIIRPGICSSFVVGADIIRPKKRCADAWKSAKSGLLRRADDIRPYGSDARWAQFPARLNKISEFSIVPMKTAWKSHRSGGASRPIILVFARHLLPDLKRPFPGRCASGEPDGFPLRSSVPCAPSGTAPRSRSGSTVRSRRSRRFQSRTGCS